jgi:hypothetical protein
MKKTLYALFILALCAAYAPARQAQGGGARLIDSFGEINTSDLKARLDNFAIELQNDPNSRGVVAAYGAQHRFPGWPLRRARNALRYLVEMRGIDASRVSLVNGGPRDETTIELWHLPAGAEPPVKPFDISLLLAGERTPLPFDRFVVMERGDPLLGEEGDPYPDDAGLYEYFAEVLRRDPGLRGYVIGYAARRGSRAADRRIASRAKLTIVKSYAVDVSRLVAVGGGRREYKMIELWLVPPGAAPPRPTPEARPARRRRR